MLHSQDIIVMKDGSTIQAQVLEIGDTDIKYKKWTNKEGPTYVLEKTNIFSINYQNGEKEVFNNQVEQQKTDKNQVFQQGYDTIDVQKTNSQKRFNVQTPYSLTGNNLVSQLENMNYEMKMERLMRKGQNMIKAAQWVFGITLIGGMTIAIWIDDYSALGWSILGTGAATSLIVGYVGGNKVRAAKSVKLKKEMNDIQILGLYEYHMNLKNDVMFSTGLAVLNDKYVGNKALGVNMGFKF